MDNPAYGRRVRRYFVMAMLAALAAGAPDSRAQIAIGSQQRLPDSRLDLLRGGYTANGMFMSIGIARTVYVNGEPVVVTTLNIPVLDPAFVKSIAAQARANPVPPARHDAVRPVAIVTAGGGAVIQNGPGNTVTLPQNLPSAATIIQNTLDNQAIRSVTTIDAKVFTADIMRTMNLTSSMREAFRPPRR